MKVKGKTGQLNEFIIGLIAKQLRSHRFDGKSNRNVPKVSKRGQPEGGILAVLCQQVTDWLF